MHTSVKQPLLPHCAVVRLPARPVNQLVTPSTALTLELCLGKDKDKDRNRDKKRQRQKFIPARPVHQLVTGLLGEKQKKTVGQTDQDGNAQIQAEETDTYVEPWYRTEVRFFRFRFLIYSEFHQLTCCWK